MSNNIIKSIVSRHYRKMAEFSKNSFAGFDADAVHHFRVEYKKLRALLRMFSFERGNDPLKITGTHKRLYILSGMLRDLQLQQLLLAQATKKFPKKPLAFFHLLQNEAARLRSEIVGLMEEKPLSENKRKIISRLPGKLNSDTLSGFCAEKWNAAGSIIKERNYSDSNIHRIRKNLKDIFYTSKEFKTMFPENTAAGQISFCNESYFEALLEEIGIFHDYCVAIGLLKWQWLNGLKPYSRALLEKIKKDWISKKIKMKQQLIIKLKGIFFPFSRAGDRRIKLLTAVQS